MVRQFQANVNSVIGELVGGRGEGKGGKEMTG